MSVRTPPPVPPAGRSPLRWIAGPVLTAAAAALLEVARDTRFAYPSPGAVFALFIAIAGYLGGIAPGLVSAGVSLAYLLWFYSDPDGLLHVTPEHLRRLPLLFLALPTIGWIVGMLRERVDEAAREAERRGFDAEFRRLFDEAGESIFLATSEGRFLYANPCMLQATGYTLAELLEIGIGELISPEALAEAPLRTGELLEQGRLVSERLVARRDGTRFLAEFAARRVADGRVIGVMHDITQARENVRRLEEALSLVRATLESTADGILVVDRAGHWAGYNQRFAQMWGLPADIVASGDDRRALDHVVAELGDPGAFIAKVRELYETPEAESFDEVLFRDGRVFERYSRPQRSEGRVLGRVWSFRDVTAARRNSETLRESERRLQQAQKLEAVGRLAGGVAHDFNNMLTAILGESELLLHELTSDSPMRGPLENIRDAAERSARLTRQLLAFGRRQPGEPRELAVAELVAGLEALVRRMAGPRVSVRLELPEPARSPWARLDPSQFEQALLNLVINAHDAMPAGGTLTVRVTRAHIEADDLARRGARALGPHVLLEVSDTGVGIDPRVRPHLFEPFFTTKEPGRGTGLGLASVYGVVEQSGGFIEVDSEPGRGAAFRIFVPEIPAPGTAGAVTADAAGLPAEGTGETILVAEDEGAVRAFVSEVLSRSGYHVLEGESGEAALSVARAHAGDIQLLLTDVVMPGMNGVELARALRAERPGLRVLFMSGFPGGVLDGPPGDEPGPPVLAKPFATLELARRIRELLDTPHAA